MDLDSNTKILPQSAFFSAEEKVQLISGDCPRVVLPKEGLKNGFPIAKIGFHGQFYLL